MKLTEAILYGFGKFYQKTISFQDGIHVIYGPNEAGKSTLHTFLGCMLFGLERGRGRAAKGDLYSRYLPWDHDATYGGSLSLESNDQIYRIQRSFRSDRRTCLLTAPGQPPTACSDALLADRCFEGLTESLYYNTISIRSLGCAPDASLAQELSRQLTDLHQTGSDTIDYIQAMSWLRSERKRQEALLTPDLEQQLLTKKQTLDHWNERLTNTSFQKRKAALQMDMDDCLAQLGALPPVDVVNARDFNHDTVPVLSSAGSRSFLLSGLCAFVLLIAAVYLWLHDHAVGSVIAGILALFLLQMRRFRRRYPSEPPQEDTQYDDDMQDDSRTHRLRQRMQSLQTEYETVCRQEWDHDRLLEQAHALEDEIEQLTARLAEEAQIRLEIQAIALASSTLQKLSTQMQDDLGPHLSEVMSRILAGLTGGIYTEVTVDGQLRVTVRTQDVVSRMVPLESLSRGTIEQIYLAMRLAVIDLLFPQGGMPLILDDCFLAYDDERLTETLCWLAENYSGQVLIFTCQKREAALLRKEQIPFTHIIL